LHGRSFAKQTKSRYIPALPRGGVALTTENSNNGQ